MSTWQNSTLIAAAIGATFGVISAATVFIYNKILEEQQHSTMTNNIDNVNRKLAQLQEELELFRTQQQNAQKNRKKRMLIRKQNLTKDVPDADTDVDSYSVAGTDFGDDEFFDCSDSEGGAGDMENGTNGGAINMDSELAEIDAIIEVEELHLDAYKKVKPLIDAYPYDVEIIWRFARICYMCSNANSDPTIRRTYILEGITACENVLGICSGHLYKWYAILIGLECKYLSTKEKIKNGYRFKEFVEKAMELLPDDGSVYHLLGRFKYDVSELSWIERKVASTLFAEPPAATYEDAIQDFEQAERLAQKPHLENKLFLAKCCLALNRHTEGVEWLMKVQEIEPVSEDDRRLQSEASVLLDKYSQYRT